MRSDKSRSRIQFAFISDILYTRGYANHLTVGQNFSLQMFRYLRTQYALSDVRSEKRYIDRDCLMAMLLLLQSHDDAQRRERK